MHRVIAAIPCAYRGARIRSTRGEVALEDLRIGDNPITREGEARRLRWIGHRSYAGQYAARSPQIQLVRIRAGAIADGVPRKPRHDTRPAPARALKPPQRRELPLQAQQSGPSVSLHPVLKRNTYGYDTVAG